MKNLAFLPPAAFSSAKTFLKSSRALFLPLLFFGHFASAQTLFVDTMQYAPADIVMDFFNGTCVDVTSVEYFGEPKQLTFFEGSQSGLGVNAGILFTTGDAQVAVGPNDKDGASNGYGIGTPDSLLQSITAGATFDRSMLHLSIVPHTDSIGFQYVFASEEYCEYVNTQFNDAFGFWIKGPGASNPDGSPRNIALVPGTLTPVAINNVNHLTNSAYYINNIATANNCGQTPAPPTIAMDAVQFDGLLTVLTAKAIVVPNETYEVWIGITDVGDGVWDSGIFLSVESLCGDSLLSPVAGFNANVNGTTVGFANTTRYATAWNWDFGDGGTSTERYPSHNYANLNQQYTVRLIATNWCCSDTSYLIVGVSAIQEEEAPKLNIYPTQFSDELVIDPADDSLSGEIVLSDISGQTLLSRSFSGKTVLRTEALPKGVYFLNINVLGKKAVIQKLVK
ncbi:MAG: choice-of-anchor L domain-containing protein [Phycisphaerae bacterium]|nr:choice-of-anchor L domain-containing protein [Saprospiraceae bacterium]